MQIHSALTQLKSAVFKVHYLTDEEWNVFAFVWQPFTAERKIILTAAGEIKKHSYFVAEGVQRAFYLKENADKEATLVFSYAGSFSGVLDSLLIQQPSRYFLETLIAREFMRTNFGQVNYLMKKFHNIETFVRKSLAFTIPGVLERQIKLRSFTAEEKFRVLLKRSLYVLQMIPHKYLASYLGLNAPTFSRLVRSVRLGEHKMFII